MQFKDVVGQEDVKQHLVGMVQQNRLSHALLFLGKDGSGGLPLSIAFAQYVMCEKVNQKEPDAKEASLFGDVETNEGPMTDSCGVCASCKKIATISHPDLHFTYPVVTKKNSGDPPLSTDYIKEWRSFITKFPYANHYEWLQHINAENKQGNITAKECGEIIHKVNMKSYEGGYKILIIWMPEFLDKQGNRLLKTLEEPPEKTIIILVGEKQDDILQTILSRTQLVKLQRLTATTIADALAKTAGVTPGKATQIAQLADGNYREAMELLKHADDEWEEKLKRWLNAILRNPKDLVVFIDEMSKIGRENQKQFFAYFLHIINLAIELRTMGLQNLPGYNNQGEEFGQIASVQFADKLNKQCTVEALEAIMNELDKATFYIERNANPKLLLHALSIKFFHIIKNNVVVELR